MEEMVNEILEKIEELREMKDRVLIAIDGRCGAGKSSLASAVRDRIGCPVIHMDDFYLSPEERTEARLAEPGGNVAYERFRLHVLDPLRRGEPACYKPYDCNTGQTKSQVTVGVAPVTLVEGSYSLHPALSDAYDLRVFLDVEPEDQIRRLEEREGGRRMADFENTWIPLEERYFQYCAPQVTSDLCYHT